MPKVGNYAECPVLADAPHAAWRPSESLGLRHVQLTQPFVFVRHVCAWVPVTERGRTRYKLLARTPGAEVCIDAPRCAYEHGAAFTMRAGDAPARYVVLSRDGITCTATVVVCCPVVTPCVGTHTLTAADEAAGRAAIAQEAAQDMDAILARIIAEPPDPTVRDTRATTERRRSADRCTT